MCEVKNYINNRDHNKISHRMKPSGWVGRGFKTPSSYLKH